MTMERQNFFRRVIFPITLIVAVMVLSMYTYDAARYLTNRTLHAILVHTSAVFMLSG